jgi:hypothetical protein
VQFPQVIASMLSTLTNVLIAVLVQLLVQVRQFILKSNLQNRKAIFDNLSKAQI